METRLDGATVYTGSFLTVRQDNVRLPDGAQATREYIHHPGAVVILPLFDDGSLLLERQFRYPLRQVFTEFPAGKLDAGEDPLRCAQRELREETGYTATQWQFLCTIHNAIGYSDEHLDLFVARGLVPGPRQLDDGEFVDLHRMTLAQALQQVQQGAITDVKTIIGIFWLDKLAAGAWPE